MPARAEESIHQEFIQIDTTNILFICGGDFEGLEKIIETRQDMKSIGFNNPIGQVQMRMSEIAPSGHAAQDLTKFGLIPSLSDVRLSLR